MLPQSARVEHLGDDLVVVAQGSARLISSRRGSKSSRATSSAGRVRRALAAAAVDHHHVPLDLPADPPEERLEPRADGLVGRHVAAPMSLAGVGVQELRLGRQLARVDVLRPVDDEPVQEPDPRVAVVEVRTAEAKGDDPLGAASAQRLLERESPLELGRHVET